MSENLYTPNCIRTVSGRYVNILELRPETLQIQDIAHALSHVPRFGGHLPVRYSVLQHSLDVHNRVKHLPRRIRLQALMHDASDFLIGDQPSPYKQHMADFIFLEEKVMTALSERFRFPWPMHRDVKLADKEALEAEWQLLMLRASHSWWLRCWLRLRQVWSVPMARRRFVKLYHELSRND